MAKVDVEDKTSGKTPARAQQGEQGRSGGTSERETEGRSLEGQDRAGWGGRGLARPAGYSSLSTVSPFDLWNGNPFAVMRRMSEDMDQMLRGFGFAPWPQPSGRGQAWDFSPPIEVYEGKGKMTVRAELPGLSKDDVKVEVTDDGLMISGERRDENEERGEGFYRSERSYGRFQRLIPLPPDVTDVESAEAKFENGVLEVSLPVPETRSRRREIPVQTAASGTSAGSKGQGTSGTSAGGSTRGTTGSKPSGR
jgi:HSP20 family protein